MIDENSTDLSFKTEAEVEAYASFFLRITPADTASMSSQEEADFNARRERNLKTQLDHFRKIDFSKANKQKINQPYVKIVNADFGNPLSSVGSSLKSTRFNYKDISLLKNRTIYLGRSKRCCELELFHLEYQRERLKRKFEGRIQEDEVKVPDYRLQTYEIELDNVLVLTSKPSCDAINIMTSTIRNEWFELNDEYTIPSASQILGTIARIKGFNGILYTSVRYQIENNLVIFEENAGELKIRSAEDIEYRPSDELFSSL